MRHYRIAMQTAPIGKLHGHDKICKGFMDTFESKRACGSRYSIKVCSLGAKRAICPLQKAQRRFILLEI